MPVRENFILPKELLLSALLYSPLLIILTIAA